MGQLVKKKDVDLTAVDLGKILKEVEKGEANIGEELKKLMDVRKKLKAQFEQAETEHFSAENKDPQDEARADLAGAQEGILENAYEMLTAAMGYMRAEKPDRPVIVQKLSDAVNKLGKYMDKLEAGVAGFRDEREAAERKGTYEN